MLPPRGRPNLHNLELLKELLLSGDIWVSQAPEIRLDVHITFVPDLHLSFARFVSQLGDSICKAKMWSDLELSVSYKSCVYGPEQTPTYNLSFGIQRSFGLVQRTTPRLPKVLKDVSDAIPPSEIPAVHMTSIDVRMEYSHKTSQCIRSWQQGCDDGGNNIVQLVQFNDRVCQGAYWLDDNLTVIEADDGRLEIDAEEMSEGWQHPDHSISKKSSFSEFGALFQEGLKTLIFGDTALRRKKNRTGPDDFKSLSRIAPSIFKLGYREAINQRSRLMPSIAKSLALMLKRSNDQTLRDKLAVGETVFASDLRSPVSTGGDSTKSMIKTRLWDVAQKRLYSNPTLKHSRPCSDHVLGKDGNDGAWDETLLSETMTKELVYIGNSPVDADNDVDFHSDICSNDNESCLDIDAEKAEEESRSIMILEDFHTESSVPIDKLTPTPPYTHTSVPLSFGDRNEIDSNQEMLDMDFDPAEDFASPPSQAFPPDYHHVYDRSRIEFRGDEIIPSQVQISFNCSQNLDWEQLVGNGEEEYDMELLCNDF
ncbi:uncharacterized protein BDW70DRAFT_148742 [Aspergillus foveolatus]|uniref:uncharacterized protein n=1 Tax=Aspergillus foveolatus TaxID=210207 RepID=UPI003CCE004A